MNPVRHAINTTAALMVVGLFAAVQALDTHDATATERAMATEARLAQHQAQQERREWQHRVSVCHRAFGPGVTPIEGEDGSFLCAGGRLKPTHPADAPARLGVQVASK